MGTRLEFVWDVSGLAGWKGDGISKAVARALRMAGNRAITSARATGKKRVRELKRIKAEYLANRSLPLTLAKGSKIASMVWIMRVSGKPVPAGRYQARQKKDGVSLTINAGKPKTFAGAFLLTMKSGHRGVFYRRKNVDRLPLQHALTTRVSDVFENEGFIEGPTGVQARAMDVFRKDYARLLPMEIAKLNK